MKRHPLRVLILLNHLGIKLSHQMCLQRMFLMYQNNHYIHRFQWRTDHLDMNDNTANLLLKQTNNCISRILFMRITHCNYPGTRYIPLQIHQESNQ